MDLMSCNNAANSFCSCITFSISGKVFTSERCLENFNSPFESHDLFSVVVIAVDVISAIEFDKTGDHLATGDRGGRVVLFERIDAKEVVSSTL